MYDLSYISSPIYPPNIINSFWLIYTKPQFDGILLNKVPDESNIYKSNHVFYLIENISTAYIFKKSLSIPPNLIRYSLLILANVQPVLE